MQNCQTSQDNVDSSIPNGNETTFSGLPGNNNPPTQTAPSPREEGFSLHDPNSNEHSTSWDKKRKHSDTHTSKREKKLSPPWKKVAADGVTSFVEDGKRKSSRTNPVPLELRAQSEKRQSRRNYGKYHDGKVGHGDGIEHEKGRESPSLLRAHPHSTGNFASINPETPFISGLVTKRSYKRAGQITNAARVSSSEGPRSSMTTVTTKSERNLKVTTRESHYEQPPTTHLAAVKRTSPNDKPVQTSSPDFAKLPRIRLRLGPRTVPVLSPLGMPPRKQHGSLRTFLEQDDPLEGSDDPRTSKEEILKEARAIARVIRAGRRGGALASAVATELEDELPKEYSAGFTHPDYLNKHLTDLQTRLLREGREHRAMAKRLALAVQEKVQAGIPKTADELEEEKRMVHRDYLRNDVLKEFHRMLSQVSAIIRERRRADLDAQEAAAGRDRMRQMVNRSQDLLLGRTGRRSLDTNQDAPTSVDPDPGRESARSVSSESCDTNDGSDASSDDLDESSASSGMEGLDMDQDLSTEQLRTKYAMLPQLSSEHTSNPSSVASTLRNEPRLPRPSSEHHDDKEENIETNENGFEEPLLYHELEEVDPMLLDDESTADSDDGTATSSECSTNEAEADESSGDEENDNPLLGFFAKHEVQNPRRNSQSITNHGHQISENDLQTNGTVCLDATQNLHQGKDISSEGDHGALISLPEGDIDATIGDGHTQMSPNMSTLAQRDTARRISPSETTSMDVLALQQPIQHVDEPEITVPSLLRGQLRLYQHAGLDWLARMYAESTNGILADEMGLGKTLQTIALLAHLATHHHVWGPHLVVVPTSVMLNWEMEFKKFCPGFKILTYYGSQEERKAKRKGWFENDRWHVCITSYQLALQDAVSLKRRGWHYLILDEAHNIKNFRSQRWQTLLSFRSQARLLLTGTPLQNNLSELWSLLFFLAPEQDEDGTGGFGSLQEFSRVFHQPVDQILEHGRGALDKESMNIVNKLHKVLRPHLLRRMKADVEKQMPKKYEHVVVCRLSKRQRQLYDSYMGLAGTRDSFASGNYMSIINCLMQLRKVCNHPDLFETRQIVTSFAMPKSAVASYGSEELLVRRMFVPDQSTTKGSCWNLWSRDSNVTVMLRKQRLSAAHELDAHAMNAKSLELSPDRWQTSVKSALACCSTALRRSNIHVLDSQTSLTSEHIKRRPLISRGLLDLLTIRPFPSQAMQSRQRQAIEALSQSSILKQMILDLHQRSELLGPAIWKFGCVTPAVVAPNMSRLVLTESGVETLRTQLDHSRPDPFHNARIRLSIAFPDKSLIQYDCGKLQQLDRLLRRLQSGGHRALIFTQMTKVLDILEQFMNLHGHRYLRLDGATRIEQRQVLTERFNTDRRILAFILSSRSGGLGINLTGADTVIFYDLDWNPAMDKQCQDRCHRIGQTRDVHIYRFVSEGTIEANILRKSNQKRMLDDVVIQEGDFTTEYLDKLGFDHGDDEANAALDRVLGGGTGQTRVLHEAEDKEDQEAARLALKEDMQADAEDFDEGPRTTVPIEDESAARPGFFTAESNQINPSLTLLTPIAPAEHTGETHTPIDPVSAQTPARPPGPGMPTSTRQELFEAFASNGLPQDKPVIQYQRDPTGALILDADGDPEQLTTRDYLLRLLEWDLADVSYLPSNDEKRRKKAKKGVAEWGRMKR